MRSGVYPLKRLSQNFLVDPNLGQKIVNSMQIRQGDVIVEIGPGEGILTRYLIRSHAASVTAIEIDERLIYHLESQFGSEEHFHLIHQDFLKTDISNLCVRHQKIRCVGNLPYGITSPILFYIMDNREYIQDMTIMVQKEVGERLTAMPNTKAYGIPSIFFQAVSDINMLFTVSRKAFRPVPGVESVVLNIAFHETVKYPIRDWPLFKTLVKTAFNQRRKMLRNTLKKWMPFDANTSVDYTKRPEQLGVREWTELSNTIKYE